MTGGTNAVGTAVIQREERVIECGSCPRRCRVAGGASRREPSSLVVRIRGGHILRLVTRVAIHRNRRVVVVQVAIGARNRSVRTRQRERSIVVVERGIGPNRRVVAEVARLRETCRHVAGIIGCVEIVQVAVHAGRAGDVVIAVDVALGALQRGVGAGKRKARRRMIKGSSGPGCRAVAYRAIGREAGSRVSRIICVLEISEVTRHAGCAGQIVIVVNVALGTRHRGVRAGQWESRRRVIETRRLPRRGVMATLAGLRESLLHVVRVRRTLEILQVASYAGRAGQIVIVVNVALGTRHSRMRAGQRKSRGGVIKGCSRPGNRVVTLLAGLGKAAADVIRVRRPLEIFQVTRNAGRIRAGQVVIAIHVALIAGDSRVGAGQREASRSVIELGVEPRIHSVALLAGGRELGGDVIRIRGLLKALGVAGVALGR